MNNNNAQEEMAELISAALLGSGHEVLYYDSQGNQVFSPSEANRIWSDSQKMMIVLGKTKGTPKRNLVTFYTSDVTDPNIFNDIKTILKRHNIYDFSFDTQPFERTLEPRHFKHMNVKESWSGTTRTSYFPVGNVNIVVKHARPWEKDNLDSARRWQRISRIMLYTPDGQRFMFPHKHILGAKAMAQHLQQGCDIWDQDGQLIDKLIKTLRALRGLQIKATRAGCQVFADQIKTTRGQIKKLLKNLGNANSYHQTIDEMYNWAKVWAGERAKIRESIRIVNSRKKMLPEARELARWYDQFDPVLILENDEKIEQVRSAWQQSNGDIYVTLDILKRNFPGWESRFEDDPKSVTSDLEDIIQKIKDTPV